MRRLFTPRKTLALLAALLALGVVWLGTRGPREPVLEGKKLGWWFNEFIQSRGSRPTREQLQTLGPGAVDWLVYKAGQTPLGERGLLRRLPMWIRQRWYSESIVDSLLLRQEAIYALQLLGPDAAPAVPSLLKILQDPDDSTHDSVADAIMATGPAGWPLAADAMLHADPHTRVTLVSSLRLRWTRDPTFGPADFAAMVEFLEPLTFDSDEVVGSRAQSGLEDCVQWWSGQPDCPEGIRLMLARFPRFRPEGRWKALEALARSGFNLNADDIIPQLTALATISDDQTRVRILLVLSQVDLENSEWAKQLGALAASPDPAVAEAAAAALGPRWNPHREIILPSTPAGSAATPTPP